MSAFQDAVIANWTKKPTCTDMATCYGVLAAQLAHRGLVVDVTNVIQAMTEAEKVAFGKRFPRLRAELRKVPPAEGSNP
jgi:hypothetical protein